MCGHALCEPGKDSMLGLFGEEYEEDKGLVEVAAVVVGKVPGNCTMGQLTMSSNLVVVEGQPYTSQCAQYCTAWNTLNASDRPNIR